MKHTRLHTAMMEHLVDVDSRMEYLQKRMAKIREKMGQSTSPMEQTALRAQLRATNEMYDELKFPTKGAGFQMKKDTK